ncbi:hypothetical protein GWI33_010436, partial [Rhynchophorus ferrugineus]
VIEVLRIGGPSPQETGARGEREKDSRTASSATKKREQPQIRSRRACGCEKISRAGFTTDFAAPGYGPARERDGGLSLCDVAVVPSVRIRSFFSCAVLFGFIDISL